MGSIPRGLSRASPRDSEHGHARRAEALFRRPGQKAASLFPGRRRCPGGRQGPHPQRAMSGCSKPGSKTPGSSGSRTSRSSLKKRAPALKHVLFQEKLGSYDDKSPAAEEDRRLSLRQARRTARTTRMSSWPPSSARPTSSRTWSANFPRSRAGSAGSMPGPKGLPGRRCRRRSMSIISRSAWRTTRRPRRWAGAPVHRRQAGFDRRRRRRRHPDDGFERSVRAAPQRPGRLQDHPGPEAEFFFFAAPR